MATAMPAIMGIAIARARRQIVEHFEIYEAQSPERAVGFVPEEGVQRAQFSAMRRKGLIHEARPAAFWLDAAAYAAEQESQRRRVALVFGLLFIVLAGVAMLAYRF